MYVKYVNKKLVTELIRVFMNLRFNRTREFTNLVAKIPTKNKNHSCALLKKENAKLTTKIIKCNSC